MTKRFILCTQVLGPNFFDHIFVCSIFIFWKSGDFFDINLNKQNESLLIIFLLDYNFILKLKNLCLKLNLYKVLINFETNMIVFSKTFSVSSKVVLVISFNNKMNFFKLRACLYLMKSIL